MPGGARTLTNPRIGRPLEIGPVRLATNLLLAPIAGYCDLAFRVVCRGLGGLGLASTDLLSPQGLLRGTATSLDLAQTNSIDRPLCMQLYGADADILADGALWAVDHGATTIDINMGCPVDKVTKKNGGSMLLCNPCGTVKMAERMVSVVSARTGGRVPVTAKMRLGWSEDRIVAPRLARDLEGVGIAAVTVHGRTTEQMFTGKASLEGIRRVVEAVERIPVIGNGDVTEPWHAVRMMELTGCAGVMIARGALSTPWIFRDAWALQSPDSSAGLAADPGRFAGDPEAREWVDASPGAMPPEPTEREKLGVVRAYLAAMLEYRDERYAMSHIRRRITWFGKRLGPCKPLREAVRLAPDPAAVLRALDEFEAGGLRVYPRGVTLAEEEDAVA
ncbi:MAG: tRNA-dihydrouridine synthase [Phycisphaerales bacterium]|nr:tRNA-dihydrouridine synthase [Phycisphaerales bacterium]